MVDSVMLSTLEKQSVNYKKEFTNTIPPSGNISANEPAVPQCTSGFLPCQNGECIPESMFCNFVQNCPDGEDEILCPSYCDFETDSCGWSETTSADDFYWMRSSRTSLPSEFQKQAPPQDHTMNTTEGHFMFILKNSTDGSHIAELKSPEFSYSGTNCMMSFWFYNFGLSVDTAELYLVINGTENKTVLWTAFYNQGNKWIPAQIQIGRISRSFQFSFRKDSLNSYDGVTAIDDVSLKNCGLPPAAESCNAKDMYWCRDTRACIDQLLLCDLIDDCGDNSDEDNCSHELQCDFENGFCNWIQDTSDDFDWKRSHGPYPSLRDTRPMKDHTTGTVDGFYLYIDTSKPQSFGDRAMLISPTLKATVLTNDRNCTFRFYYHMYGKHVNKLIVYKRVTSNTMGQEIWHKEGSQVNMWLRQTISITSSVPFQILLEGYVGDNINGDIAIDDLSFIDCSLYYGELPTIIPTTPSETSTLETLPPHNCTGNEFVCRTSGGCINVNQKCDFRDDCQDKSDEFFCAKKNCNFEDGNMCGWFKPLSTSRTAKKFQWSTGQGSTISPGEEGHRPSNDHTMSTVNGWYLYADSSNGKFGNTADITTPMISLTGPKCKLLFWTYMHGATVGSLQVYIKSGNTTLEIWSQSGSQGPFWQKGEVFLGIHSSVQIILRAKRGVSYVGDVTVDDIAFEDCSPLQLTEKACSTDEYTCANKYCVPKDNLCDFVNDCGDHSDESPLICRGFFGRCDFEFDFCFWQQGKNDDFDWALRARKTPAIGTCPTANHTLHSNTGHYLFLESSFSQLPFQMATISSPPICRRSKDCKITFFYHMFGKGIGNLELYIVTVENQKYLLFNLSRSQGNFWQRKEILLQSKDDFKVVFLGQLGPTGKGDIALDDISFSNGCIPSFSLFPGEDTSSPTGSCPHGYLTCQNGRCYRPEQSCDFVNDCGDNTDEKECGTSCDFERGMCGWKNSLADNFDWILGVGSFQSLRPTVDHTHGDENGHFLFLEATPLGLKGDKAHLRSSKWKESGTFCTMTFWYYITAKVTGLIRVLVKTERSLSEVWSKTGNHGDEWHIAEVSLRRLRNFEVIFEGIRTQDFGGGAAVDDIHFKNCAPVGELPGQCPVESDYFCQNKKCIESGFICDYKPDCEDTSDEYDCGQYFSIQGSCNFESDLDTPWPVACGLSQNDNDDFDWSLGNSAPREGTGPDTDHTPGPGKWFLYINSANQRKGNIAMFTTTNSFPASMGLCSLRFWFYMYGSNLMGVLKVYIVQTSGLHIRVWSANGNYGKEWIYAKVLLSSTTSFKVAFEAEVGGDNLTDIAVDDITFTPECVTGGPILPEPRTCDANSIQCTLVHECIPVSWMCDGEEDCVDGTDESLCPTKSPGTLPPQECYNKTEFQCSDGTCIPSLLRCDKVPDCPEGEDENSCSTKDCFNGSVLCESTDECIPVSQRCDGIEDCRNFFPDESSCSGCPDNYCRHGGTCIIQKAIPFCLCTAEWKGNRCHIKIKPHPSPTSHQTSGSGLGEIWAGLAVGLALLTVGLVFGICYLFRQKIWTR
ncbi:MAM and LDL-receptor class A domain-containing protein 1 [Protopterus annectens]|uniref:MAM and LDL-receptor class A domain-containing protein 1 n=1 Tax=Protopterus annectens TaxID=7888 RepID=UPI001CFADE89|nr:MAM and LDL-receptor class A domain-containing protein 1 [Protopterus annectens]